MASTKATPYRKLTQAELIAEARERFGNDPLQWAFLCPSCGDVATGQDFNVALAEHPRTNLHTNEPVIASDIVGQECIGRTLGALDKGRRKYTGRGCDWAAYGLFAGPWEIALPNGRTVHAFPLAPAPTA
ncbi:VVA0879 family protein [Streptomyces sp. NPDC094153]|uniref:VVA0879 family protein n=1 Tax=Streptomyces sp. NPDC094153 TaxID=3366058 RepID=UPI00381303BA